MRKVIASVAFLILSSVTTFAADIPIRARPVPVAAPIPVYNWTGWYVGIHGGGFWGDTSNSLALPNVSASSGFVGVQGGYRWHLPSNWVFGLQLSAPLWASDQNKVILPGIINTAKFKGSIIGQAQVGYAFDRWLPFVTGGVGAVRVEGQEVIAGVGSLVVTNTHMLYQAGVGVNYGVTDNFTVGVRYNHIWTSHETYACGAFCAPPASIWFNADTVTGVLEYKFL